MLPAMTRRTLARAAALTLALQAGLAAAGEGAGEDSNARQIVTRTGKERLGGKASDEQRVDKCKVPPDRRGAIPRPDTCREDASTGSTR